MSNVKTSLEPQNQPSCLGAVSSGFSNNLKYRMHLDNMKFEICELVNDCFDAKCDPEVQWKFFREQLTHYKREQILKWLETDDN